MKPCPYLYITMLLAPALHAAEYALPRNQTLVREQNMAIPTIWYDVRSPMLLTQPGGAMGTPYEIDLTYRQHHLYREAFQNPQQRDQGEDHIEELRWKTRLAPWLFTELRCLAHAGAAANDIEASDAETLAGLQLYRDRYRGAAFVVGAAWPIGPGHVWGDGHRDDLKKPFAVAELRFTESLGWTVFHLNIGGRFGHDVHFATWEETPINDAITLPQGTFAVNRYVRYESRLGFTYRPLLFLRLGAEAEARYETFTKSVDTGDLRFNERSLVTLGFLEFNPSRTTSLRLAGGIEPDVYSKLGRKQGGTFGAGLGVRW